jgi:heterodisulfide reductase subunit C
MIPADSRLEACIQCGTCGGSCPSERDMDHTPRQIFALIRAGARDRVCSSNTPWMCVSCYLCAVRCPQKIHIPDVMYALKAKATQEGRVPGHVAPDFSRTFVEYIHKYGRSFEVGLVAKHYLRHYMTRLPHDDRHRHGHMADACGCTASRASRSNAISPCGEPSLRSGLPASDADERGAH